MQTMHIEPSELFDQLFFKKPTNFIEAGCSTTFKILGLKYSCFILNYSSQVIVKRDFKQ